MDTPQLGTNEYPVFTTFNVKKGQCVPFLDIFYYIHKNGRHTVNRKGQGLYEMRNVTLVLDPEASTYCLGRYPSQEYLEKELDFYASGSRQLEDAVKMSKFWSKCSDDGKPSTATMGSFCSMTRISMVLLSSSTQSIACVTTLIPKRL